MQFSPTPSWLDLRPGAMPRPIDRQIRLARLLARRLLPDFAVDWADDLVRETADVLRGDQPADAVILTALNLLAAPKLDRGELEARLLAEQQPADVAAAMGLPADVVDKYAKLFFDLTGNLNARSWMMQQGIGPKAYYGLKPDDIDVILKLVGFRDGLGDLELAVRYYRRGLHRVADLDTIPDLDTDEKAWARSFRAWVALRTLNDRVALLKLRLAFPETKPEPVVGPGLHYRATLDVAAEAVARAAEVVQVAPKTADVPVTAPAETVTAPAETARESARRRSVRSTRRRTVTKRRRAADAAFALAGG